MAVSAPVLTIRVQKVLDHARQEAIRLHHPSIEPEHVALGLIREREGVAIAVLQQFHVDLDELSAKLEASLAARPQSPTDDTAVPYSPATQKVIDSGKADAQSRNHMYVGTEHLLLGILADPSNLATQVLASFSVSESAASAETSRLLGTPIGRQ